jgi:hypothetical protein
VVEIGLKNLFVRPSNDLRRPLLDPYFGLRSCLAKSPSESLENDGNLAALLSGLKSLEAVLLNWALIYARFAVYFELLIRALLFKEIHRSLATLLIFRG